MSREDRILNWLKEVQAIAPQKIDWIGVYFKASYYLNEDSTDLVLGPFIGEDTDHKRIPIDKGYCGMALREEKTVNIDDVTKSDVHIACSLETRSELVIPLKDKSGVFIAELDLDSNTLSAFDKELVSKVKASCESFSDLL